MAEELKPIRTKITQKFDDGSKLVRHIPEPEVEIPEAPKMYKETEESLINNLVEVGFWELQITNKFHAEIIVIDLHDKTVKKKKLV